MEPVLSKLGDYSRKASYHVCAQDPRISLAVEMPSQAYLERVRHVSTGAGAGIYGSPRYIYICIYKVPVYMGPLYIGVLYTGLYMYTGHVYRRPIHWALYMEPLYTGALYIEFYL